jgi:AcrR family transcriptional regulator
MRSKDIGKEQNIRQKAIEMIVNEGLYGFGINKLAKAAGVSPATIYIYFEDKEQLISTICMEVGTELMEYSLKGFRSDMSLAEGMKTQWVNRLSFFMEHPMETEFLEIIRYTIFYEKVSKMMTERFGKIKGDFINNAVVKGELLDLPFEIYWSVAFAPLYQLIKFHTQGKSYVNSNFSLTEDLMMQALELVIKALTP